MKHELKKVNVFLIIFFFSQLTNYAVLNSNIYILIKTGVHRSVH